ncbi:MAG: Hemerythrin cation binding domain protein [Gammaproteobacteria bacterium]|nr:Hemerythrin cation binding domain protein [Gammaproteobacteria bacterium]
MMGRNPIQPAGAIEMLQLQHRRLHQLFVDFFAARSESRRYDLMPIICSSVKLHLTLEAECFFPTLSRATGDDWIAKSAEKERACIDALIYELEFPDPGSYLVSEQVYVLSETIRTHIARAERPAGLFERTRMSNIDADALGFLLRRRNRELQEAWHGDEPVVSN